MRKVEIAKIGDVFILNFRKYIKLAEGYLLERLANIKSKTMLRDNDEI